MNEVGGKHETPAPTTSWDSMSVPQGPPIPITHENIQQVMVPVPIKMQPPPNLNPMMEHGNPMQQGPMTPHVRINLIQTFFYPSMWNISGFDLNPK